MPHSDTDMNLNGAGANGLRVCEDDVPSSDPTPHGEEAPRPGRGWVIGAKMSILASRVGSAGGLL